MATCGVYSIKGPSGKHYVGQAMHIERRFFSHYAALKAGTHPCQALQAEWDAAPCGNFQFTILCETDLYSDDRFAIEQVILTRVPLYNEYKKVIRTCAWFPSYFTESAFERIRMTQRVNIIRPQDEWFSISETGVGWSLKGALARDNHWYIGVIQDSQKWALMRTRMSAQLGFIAYNPVEHYKRLSADKFETMPKTRQAFSPYVLVNLKRGVDDVYLLKNELVPISLTSRGYVQSLEQRHIDMMNWQEDHCEFISTEKERNNAMRIHNLKHVLNGSTLVRSDREKAVVFKRGIEYELPNVDISDFYEQSVLTA